MVDRRRWWHPTLVLLPGESHGQRSLVGCSPWGCEDSDMTERLHFHFSLSCIGEGNGNPLQCSCLENPRDGGAWQTAIYGVAQSRTQLKWLSSSSGSRFGKKKIYFSVSCLPTIDETLSPFALVQNTFVHAELSRFSRVWLLVTLGDCSLLGPSVCGILQAGILEWVAISSSRGSFWPRDWTCVSYVSCIGGFFNH